MLLALVVFGGCDELLPIDPIKRCEGENPPPDCSCADNAAEMDIYLGPRAASCPECSVEPRHRDCMNIGLSVAGSGGTAGRGGSSGGGAGTSGTSGATAGTNASTAGSGGMSGGGSSAAGSTAAGSGGTAACASCGAGQHCLGGLCVDCRDDDDCDDAGGTPRCDLINHVCVACLDHGDCKDPLNGQCFEHECRPCQDSSHCKGDPTKPNCEPQSHACVECVTHGNCSDAERPQCNDEFACEPCTLDVACASRDGLTVCDDEEGSGSLGKCVECTGKKFESCTQSGSEYVCDSRARSCSDQVINSAHACDACVSDAQCAGEQLCMPMTFGGSEEIGTYCLWPREATGSGAPDGDCLNVRQYLSAESGWTSVDGEATTVCKPATTTCAGIQDFRGKTCSGATVAGDAECGAAGLDDAVCAPWGGGHRCTYSCINSQDDCANITSGGVLYNECQTAGVGPNPNIKICAFD